jgi:8-amino-7-oxononanoate synthase
MRAYCDSELRSLREADRLRRRRVVVPVDAVRATVDGHPVVVMCSNDYLGLASSPVLAAAIADGAQRWGSGSGASRLISGSLLVHAEAEARLASFVGVDAALLFNSGYQANLGFLTALTAKGDTIYSDALNHASLIDGCRLSRANVQVYPHNDLGALEHALRHRPKEGRAWIVTETLFSMDGDVPDLRALSRFARQYGAFLVADEAHSLGVFGPDGRGLCAEAGIVPDLIIGTLGKAFGCSGAFVAGPTEAIELLVNRARTFIYTTAMPPALAAGIVQAVALVEAAGERREQVHALAGRVRMTLERAGIETVPGRGPIVPILLGGDARAVDISEALLARGFFVPAIRPPTVSPGASRLRLTLSAAHSFEQLDEFCRTLKGLLESEPPPARERVL